MLLTDVEGDAATGGARSSSSPTPSRRKLSVRKVYDRLQKYLAQGMDARGDCFSTGQCFMPYSSIFSSKIIVMSRINR